MPNLSRIYYNLRDKIRKGTWDEIDTEGFRRSLVNALKKGFPIDYIPTDERLVLDTLLQEGAFRGSIDVCAVLLENGADINAKNRIGRTALMSSIYGRRPMDMIRFLTDKGIDLNAKDNFGETALMKAAYYGIPDIVELLLEAGASIDIKNGKTALENACQYYIYLDDHDYLLPIIDILTAAGSKVRNWKIPVHNNAEEYRRNFLRRHIEQEMARRTETEEDSTMFAR